MNRVNGIIDKVKSYPFLQNLRSFEDFLHPRNFSLPEDANHVLPRLQHNSIHYLSNYLIILIITAFYSMVFSPLLLLIVVILLALGYFFFTRVDDVIIGEDLRIQHDKKVLLFIALAVIMLVGFCGPIIVIIFLITSLLCFAHSFFHNVTSPSSSKSSKSSLLSTQGSDDIAYSHLDGLQGEIELDNDTALMDALPAMDHLSTQSSTPLPPSQLQNTPKAKATATSASVNPPYQSSPSQSTSATTPSLHALSGDLGVPQNDHGASQNPSFI